MKEKATTEFETQTTREWFKTYQAARKWVERFREIPRKTIEAAPEEWCEITPPVPGDRVAIFSYSDEYADEYGEVKDFGEESDSYTVELDGRFVVLKEDELLIVRSHVLPVWETMWSFTERDDLHWLTEEGGLRLMAECGFRIFQHEEFGYFFGIDGVGYDFLNAHFIPLYCLRKKEAPVDGEH